MPREPHPIKNPVIPKENFLFRCKNYYKFAVSNSKHSPAHKIIKYYTLFNTCYVICFIVSFIFLPSRLDSIDITFIASYTKDVFGPISILLSFIMGFIQFAKQNLRNKYLHARTITANMFLGLTWINLFQLIIVSKLIDPIKPLNTSAYIFYSFLILLMTSVIFFTNIYLANSSLLKPIFIKGGSVVGANVATPQLCVYISLLAIPIYFFLSEKNIETDAFLKLFLNYSILIFFTLSICYAFFSILCISYTLFATASRLNSGLIDICESPQTFGDKAYYETTTQQYCEIINKLLPNHFKTIIEQSNNKERTDLKVSVNNATIIAGPTRDTKPALMKVLDELVKYRDTNPTLSKLCVIHITNEFPEQSIARANSNLYRNESNIYYFAINLFSLYASFGEDETTIKYPPNVYRVDPELMLDIHIKLRQAFNYLKEYGIDRNQLFTVFVIDSLCFLINTMQSEDIRRFFAHICWKRAQEKAHNRGSCVIALADEYQLRNSSDSFSTYLSLLNYAQHSELLLEP